MMKFFKSIVGIFQTSKPAQNQCNISWDGGGYRWCKTCGSEGYPDKRCPFIYGWKEHAMNDSTPAVKPHLNPSMHPRPCVAGLDINGRPWCAKCGASGGPRQRCPIVYGRMSNMSDLQKPTSPITDAVELAYGLLWHVTFSNRTPAGQAIHGARKALLEQIDRDGQRRGIEAAKAFLRAPT
jgi:hypothetical protein